MTDARAQFIARAVLVVAGLVLFVGGGARFAIGLALKPMEVDLGSGRSLIGAAVALFQIVSACAMFWSGRLADRLDVTRVLAGGTAIAALGMGAMAFAREPWQVLLLYGVVFAIGNGMASVIPVGVLVTRHFPKRAGLASAIALAGLGLGQLVMMYALTPVLAAVGWRSVFGWLGVVHIAIVPIVIAVVGQSRQALDKASEASARSDSATAEPPLAVTSMMAAMKTRRFGLLLAVYALCGFEDFFVSTHIVALAQDRGVERSWQASCWHSWGLRH